MREARVDIVFAPSGAEMYPQASPRLASCRASVPAPGSGGATTGHFSGMLTVVLKLLNLTDPDVALFGEKDYQQLVLIATMVADFNLPIEIVGVATSRESDGLARSSRNVYLSPGPGRPRQPSRRRWKLAGRRRPTGQAPTTWWRRRRRNSPACRWTISTCGPRSQAGGVHRC